MLRLEQPAVELEPTPPPVQILDAIDFEEKFKRNEIELITYQDKPSDLANAIKRVNPREKRNIMATYTLSSLGLGLGCTLGVLLKFIAPVAFGGAGFIIATEVLIGLTAGAGLLAIGLAFFVHQFYTKEAIKTIGMQLAQHERLQEGIKQKAAQILNQINQNFGMLLKMKLALTELKRSRELLNPNEPPSHTERQIEARIESYINFLVQHPDHPNFQKIENQQAREQEIQLACERQKQIRKKLDEACNELITKNTSANIKKYLDDHRESIRDCFPSLKLDAPRTKPPRVITNPAIGLALLGSFSGSFGLSYFTIGLVTVFTTLPIAFPPLYVILAVALTVASLNAYVVYKSKCKEAARNTEKKDLQKQLTYYHKSNRLMERRHADELKAYCEYEPEVIRTQATRDLSPQGSPESKNSSSSKKGLAIFFDDSSTVNLPELEMKNENLTFRDPADNSDNLPPLVPTSPCRSYTPLIPDSQKSDEDIYEQASPRRSYG